MKLSSCWTDNMPPELPRSCALTSALISTSVRTACSGFMPRVVAVCSSTSGGIARPEYLSKLDLRLSIGGAQTSACRCASIGTELWFAAPASSVDACASCNACATSMTNVRDPVLGMRLCRRGERGNAEEGWACDRNGEGGEGIEG